MPWLRFTRDFDFSPPERSGLVTIAYRAGFVGNVTRACADAAKTADAAVGVRPQRAQATQEVTDEGR